MFFVSASKITKFRNTEKKKFEENFKEGNDMYNYKINEISTANKSGKFRTTDNKN